MRRVILFFLAVFPAIYFAGKGQVQNAVLFPLIFFAGINLLSTFVAPIYQRSTQVSLDISSTVIHGQSPGWPFWYLLLYNH